MNLKEVRDLVSLGENQTIEFKRKVAFPEKVVREMVAFANTSGGYLLVGVEDDGSMPGLKNPEEHDYALNKAVVELCVPRLKYKRDVIALSEKKSVLCYKVDQVNRKPLYAKENAQDKYGKAYVRVADKTIQASREMTQILRKGNSKKSHSFTYGEKEAVLMRLLDQEGQTTLSRYADEANINRRVASSTLVLLVLSGVLEISPSEKEDIFKLKKF